MHWRDEPLTRGDMYDALMQAAADVEESSKALARKFRLVPGMGKVAGPVTDLATNVVRGAANAISKETK